MFAARIYDLQITTYPAVVDVVLLFVRCVVIAWMPHAYVDPGKIGSAGGS